MSIETVIFYLYVCLAEEGLFRMVPFEWLSRKHLFLAYLAGIIPYALSHFILFDWLVVLLCVPLGIVNSVIYYNLKRPYGYLVCVLIHFVAGGIMYLLGVV